MNEGEFEEAKSTRGFDGAVSAAWLSDTNPLPKKPDGVILKKATLVMDRPHSPRNKMSK